METWWVVLVIIVLAALSGLFIVLRNSRQEATGTTPGPVADRDFVQERETVRLGGMSEEDQAWQAASLDRERATRAETPPDVKETSQR